MLIWCLSIIFVIAVIALEPPKSKINHLAQYQGRDHHKPERPCRHKPDCRRRHEGRCGCCHHRKSSENFEFKDVEIKPYVGIYAFNFGKTAVPIKQTFTFFATQQLLLTVWDCFCSGDSFNVFDNQVFLGSTARGPIEGKPCDYYSCEPKECLTEAINLGHFYWYSWTLLPGKHNVTMIPYLSPYGKGTAFLRLDKGCPQTNINDPLVPCCFQTFSCSYQILNNPCKSCDK